MSISLKLPGSHFPLQKQNMAYPFEAKRFGSGKKKSKSRRGKGQSLFAKRALDGMGKKGRGQTLWASRAGTGRRLSKRGRGFLGDLLGGIPFVGGAIKGLVGDRV